MKRMVPGTDSVAGREFIYVEVPLDETFDDLLDRVTASSSDMPMPTSGGVIEEKVRIEAKPDMTLMGLSYKGDLIGWRRLFESYCEKKRLARAIVRDGKLVFSSGEEIMLKDCVAHFDE